MNGKKQVSEKREKRRASGLSMVSSSGFTVKGAHASDYRNMVKTSTFSYRYVLSSPSVSLRDILSAALYFIPAQWVITIF